MIGDPGSRTIRAPPARENIARFRRPWAGDNGLAEKAGIAAFRAGVRMGKSIRVLGLKARRESMLEWREF